VRKHCEVLTIPLDLRETGWILLKLKKFVKCKYVLKTADIAAGQILPARRSAAGDLGEGEDAQEPACAHKEV